MKIIRKQIIKSTKYLNFVETEFLNKNDQHSKWYSAERPNLGKTVLIAALHGNKLVVTREFRVPIGNFEWSLPSGLVDGNESASETAIRELKEETNLNLIEIKETTPFLINSAGMSNEVVSIVFCTADGRISDSGTESSEEISCFLMDREQLAKLINDTSKKISAKAYLIFDRFIHGRLW